MRDPLQRQRQEIRQGEVGPSHLEVPGQDLSSPYRCDLQIDQFRRGQSVTAKTKAGCIAISGVVGEGGAKTLASTTITILPEDLGRRLDRHSTAGPSARAVEDLKRHLAIERPGCGSRR